MNNPTPKPPSRPAAMQARFQADLDHMIEINAMTGLYLGLPDAVINAIVKMGPDEGIDQAPNE